MDARMLAAERLRTGFDDPDSSVRLQAALTAGTYPDPALVEVLIERCAIEPDFYVRDMLTWALTRHPASITVPCLLVEAGATGAQARSQALHTLSKVGDPRGWAAITREVLGDADAEVARSAWRAAVVLVPTGGEAELASTLVDQLGRGDREMQLSLARAFADLGDAALPALAKASGHLDSRVRIQALAIARIVNDPTEGYDAALFEAEREAAVHPPVVPRALPD